jgi:hypothetical protein
MKLLGQIILVCALVCVLQALVAVIATAFMLLLIWGLLFRTREAAGLIALCLLTGALNSHPTATIGIIILLFGILLIARWKASNRGSARTPAALLPRPSPPD